VHDEEGGSAANQTERRRWNDERWTRVWLRREVLTAEVTPSVVAALRPEAGERILEIGSGGGRLAIEVAGRVQPGGSVVGVDLSETLVALARRRAGDARVAAVEFTVADAQTAALPGPFDAAVSQFGVMFFDDPVAAFTNVRRRLRPGGRLVFACWQDVSRNLWHTGPVISRFVPPGQAPPIGPTAPGPFALATRARTDAILADAGFADIERHDTSRVVSSPADALYDEEHLTYLGVPAADLPAAREAIEERLGRFLVGDGHYEFPIAYSICTATNPIR
jgi:SAM-dependent methyltransferase